MKDFSGYRFNRAEQLRNLIFVEEEEEIEEALKLAEAARLPRRYIRDSEYQMALTPIDKVNEVEEIVTDLNEFRGRPLAFIQYLIAQEDKIVPKDKMTELPEHLRGDGPCMDCGTKNNIIWSTDSEFWNEIMRKDGAKDWSEILCVPCFVIRVDKAGFYAHWRLTPSWHWETKEERSTRRAKDV